MLLLLRHPPGEHHAGAGHRLKPRPLRTVPGDHQLPAHHVPDPVPQPQQQVKPFVVGEPAHREEQRIRRPRGRRIGLLDTVAYLPDPVLVHPHPLQRRRGGVGHGEEQVAAVHPGHDLPLDVPADGGDGRKEPDRPQVGVHVVHQAEHRAPGPQRRQIGHPVADLHDQVGVPEVPQVGEGRAGELGIRAAVAHHAVRPLGHRPAAQQRHPVAAGEHAGGQPVDQDLGSPGALVGEVPPRDEQDVPGPDPGTRVRQPEVPGPGDAPLPSGPRHGQAVDASLRPARLRGQSALVIVHVGSRPSADDAISPSRSQIVIPYVRIAALFCGY